jgi:integration host factor subunit beta
MLKSELIERIAERNPHLSHRDAEKIVITILDTITAALAQGDRVELRDFGVLSREGSKR